MSKLKAFFYIFSKSLTSPEYYKDVVNSDKKLSFKYFFTLALFASLITSIHTLAPLLPKVRDTLNNVVERGVALYEDDLIITVQSGLVSINKPEPYIIPVPWDESSSEDVPESLIVFDKSGTVDDFLNKYDSFSMINASNIILRDQSGFRVEDLKQVPDGVVTKATIEAIAAKVEKLIVYLPYLLSVAIFIGVFIYYAVVRFSYLFIVAAFLFVFGKVKKLGYRYTDYLKISIHTFTLPLMIEVIFRFVDDSLLVRFPLWFFAVNVIFGIFVLFSLAKKPQELVKINNPD